MLATKAMNHVELKPMHTCSFETALEVWNEGFQGYFVEMTLTLDRLLDRLTASRVSPELSLIAFDGDRPVGFLFNAIQVIGDKKFAWNGGTGVIPDYRGKGVGKELVKETIDLYRAHDVDIASLEAISTNYSAIKLYQRFGYEVIDELTYLQSTEPTFGPEATRYEVVNTHPTAVSQLKFYRKLSPWQCQWQSLALRGGEAIVVFDSNQTPLGYALYEKRFDQKGNVTRIALFQCEVASGRSDEKQVAQLMLQRVFRNEELKCQRTTVNFPKSNAVVIDLLNDAGFKTFIEQLQMNLKLN